MNEQAHNKVPRLHLPVAPACNSSCIYCRRGLTSTDHTVGPGRTESILSPEEALKKTEEYLQKWTSDAIVGIAGPGDPLANVETIETLRLLHQHHPTIRLCLCTNGLCMLDHLPFLQEIGLHHLTVTVNGVDPKIVERIQPWLRYKGELIAGAEAAEMLIERQLKGIAQATEGGDFH